MWCGGRVGSPLTRPMSRWSAPWAPISPSTRLAPPTLATVSVRSPRQRRAPLVLCPGNLGVTRRGDFSLLLLTLTHVRASRCRRSPTPAGCLPRLAPTQIRHRTTSWSSCPLTSSPRCSCEDGTADQCTLCLHPSDMKHHWGAWCRFRQSRPIICPVTTYTVSLHRPHAPSCETKPAACAVPSGGKT